MGKLLFVSIPKRVSEVLKLWFGYFAKRSLAVSIPKRVSEVLKPYAESVYRQTFTFQSLKGFQRFWSLIPLCFVCFSENSFQSLKGFQRFWSYLTSDGTAAPLTRQTFAFQSLIQRFWSHCPKSQKMTNPVSIPKRVSEVLKPSDGIAAPLTRQTFAFQSLKGFQRFWSQSITNPLLCSL